MSLVSRGLSPARKQGAQRTNRRLSVPVGQPHLHQRRLRRIMCGIKQVKKRRVLRGTS
jgi:hypothetical protein